MKDSVPHLALLLLLLELASNMGGRLACDHENIIILAVPLIIMVFFLDCISLISLKTDWVDKLLKRSLVKDEPKPLCHPDNGLSYCPRFAHVFNNALHIFGYIISVGVLLIGHSYKHDKDDCNYVSNQTKTKDNADITMNCTHGEPTTFHRQHTSVLVVSLFAYPLLLLMVEFYQMMNARKLKLYFNQRKNLTDLFEIVISLVIASVCAKPAFTGCPFPEWMPNLIFAVVLLTSFQLVTNLAECLPYNDIIHVEKYLHMFYQVAKRYFWIVLGFLPLLMMFAFCFQGVFPSIIYLI